MKNVEVDGVTYNGVSSVSLRTTSGSYANFIDEDETTQTVVNSVSGKIIHVDDAVTNGVQDLELFDSGGTEITAATTVCIANKNLFRIDLLSTSTVSKGITFTKNADGSITANGTSTGTYASASVTLDPAIFQAGQVFTISCGKTTGDLYVQLILNYTDGTTDYLVSRTGPTVFMVPKAVSTVTASVQITASGVTLTNQTIYPQIELAGTPSAFVMNTYSQISYNGSTMPTLPASVANLWTFSSTVASMTMTYTVDVSANADHLQSQNDTTTAVMLTKITRPEGGTIGQVLTKIGDDEETWDDVHGLPDGGTNGQVLTHTEDGAAWRDVPLPTVDSVMSSTSTNPVQNAVVKAAIDSAVATETTARQTADTALSGQISALQAAVGSPLVASTAAAMVDTTKIYVYTGSETGYTAGNWYYYDGSAWTSGGTYQSRGIGAGTITGQKLSADLKEALLIFFEHVALTDQNGQTYYNNLVNAFNSGAVLLSISAVFTPGANIIYDNDSLDVLKQYLTVTANYDDGTNVTVTSYTLSGTLAEGTCTITVTYSGKTATFSVTVEQYWDVVWTASDGSPTTKGFGFYNAGGGTGVVQSDGFLVTNGSSNTDSSIRPTTDFNPDYSDVEVEFQIKTMPASSMGWVMGVVGFQNSTYAGTIWANPNNNLQNTGYATAIENVTINTNKDYKMRIKSTPTLVEVYLDDLLVYSHSGTRTNTRNRFLVNAASKSMSVLYKAIRLKDTTSA